MDFCAELALSHFYSFSLTGPLVLVVYVVSPLGIYSVMIQTIWVMH